MKERLKRFMIPILILCILVGIYFLWPIITDGGTELPGGDEVNQEMATITSDNNHKPVAYVSGAVATPGLYEIEENATVGNLIALAGGLLPYADVDSLNMAESVSGGDHVHVIFNFHGNPEMLLRGKKININTATIKDIDTLPGIGPATAKRIEEYRNQKGPFTSIEGIKEVKGIGDGLFKKIHDKITI